MRTHLLGGVVFCERSKNKMSSGGKLRPWLKAHQIVVRMLGSGSGIFSGANQNASNITLDLGRPVENLVEVWLTEYMIRNNGTPVANNMWRIDLSDNQLESEQSCNSAGNGFCVAVPDMTATTHIVYDTPRVVSINGKRGMSSLRVKLTDEFGAAVVFHDATFFLTLVYVNPILTLRDVQNMEKNHIEWWRSNENVGRFVDRTTYKFV
jgi:hypothetical protein